VSICMLLLLDSRLSSALAACLPGGQCEVSDGSTQDLSNNAYQAIGTGQNNAALRADNGSKLEGSTVTVTTAPHSANNNEYLGTITGGSTIDLKDSNLSGDRGLIATGDNASLLLDNSNIAVEAINAIAFTDNNASGSKLEVLGGVVQLGSGSYGGTANRATIDFSTGGDVLIDNATLKVNNDSHRVIHMDSSTAAATLTMKNGWTVEKNGMNQQAIFMGKNVTGNLSDGKIILNGLGSSAIRANGDLTLTNVDITASQADNGGIIVSGSSGNASLKMTGGKIELLGNGGTALQLSSGADGEFDNVKITSKNTTAASFGISIGAGTDATFKNNSSIIMEGVNAHAIQFDWSDNNSINVDESQINSKDGFAVVASGTSDNKLSLTKKSHIEGDRLLFAVGTSKLVVDANDSQLFGHALKQATATTIMNLSNDSVWTLRPNATGSNLNSSINQLSLDKAAVVFDRNGTSHYQKLLINQNTLPYAYEGKNGATITFNTLVNDGGAPSNQFTDRLLIHGNVQGTTIVNINDVSGSSGDLTSPARTYLNNEGISLIQVSGTAAENSFALPGGYTTIGGLPYMYELYAYGPSSSRGAADSSQADADLIALGGSNNWDFRLQAKTPDSGDPLWMVAPQVANYLSASQALFHTGLQDIGSLRKRLGTMRQNLRNESDADLLQAFVAPQNEFSRRGFDEVYQSNFQLADPSLVQRGEFFFRAYGGNYAYRSHLKTAQYGIDSDVTYKATQAGGNFYGFEKGRSQMRFGLSGSWGVIGVEPDRQGSQKSNLEVWSVAPYATWQHDNGAYVDVVLSYGGFNGLVSTPSRGRTARLQGNSLTSSIEAGLPFALKNKNITIEATSQLIYQKLYFDKTRDVENFVVELGSPEQWTAIAGIEVAKSFSLSSGQNAGIYGKLNLSHAFNDHHKAWLGDDFNLGQAGSHIEVGLGGKLALGQKLNLHTEVSWQDRLSRGGVSGISLNGGFSLKF